MTRTEHYLVWQVKAEQVASEQRSRFERGVSWAVIGVLTMAIITIAIGG